MSLSVADELLCWATYTQWHSAFTPKIDRGNLLNFLAHHSIRLKSFQTNVTLLAAIVFLLLVFSLLRKRVFFSCHGCYCTSWSCTKDVPAKLKGIPLLFHCILILLLLRGEGRKRKRNIAFDNLRSVLAAEGQEAHHVPLAVRLPGCQSCPPYFPGYLLSQILSMPSVMIRHWYRYLRGRRLNVFGHHVFFWSLTEWSAKVQTNSSWTSLMVSLHFVLQNGPQITCTNHPCSNL